MNRLSCHERLLIIDDDTEPCALLAEHLREHAGRAASCAERLRRS
jgi:hypothetical protein